MKKNGFTLVELLVVIAIIGILSIIIVPSVINVNKNVNTRLLDSKKQNITTAATLYASKNDDIFNGVDEVPVYVYELINMGYVEIDVATNADNRCVADPNHEAKGCVLNPVTSGTLNLDYVILRKQGAAGYTAEYVESDIDYNNGSTPSDRTLVTAVCEGFGTPSSPGNLVGKSSTGKQCFCYKEGGSDKYNKLRDVDGVEVTACIISGENPNNYLRYGDSKPNWRVLGVYKISDDLVAKMITSEPI